LRAIRHATARPEASGPGYKSGDVRNGFKAIAPEAFSFSISSHSRPEFHQERLGMLRGLRRAVVSSGCGSNCTGLRIRRIGLPPEPSTSKIMSLASACSSVARTAALCAGAHWP
jgi:hypothetical protein